MSDLTWNVRNCYVPRPGYKIVTIDVAGLELASAAHQLQNLYGDSEMCQAINRGTEPTDLHSLFANRLKAMKEKDYKGDYNHFVANKKEKGYKEFRQLAKPLNLGFPGGIGYDTMRFLLSKDGIFPEYEEIAQFTSRRGAYREWFKYNREFPRLRVRTIGQGRWALVLDELVELKKEMFKLYPDLERFLKKGHERFFMKDGTGNVITKRKQDEFGNWEDEEYYKFDIYNVKRRYCTYTALCNNYLMQTPSAVAAKQFMVAVIKKYFDDSRMNPLIFIHDEIVFEVLDNDDMYDIIDDVSKMFIEYMQRILSNVRICVEWGVFDYWRKDNPLAEGMMWRDVCTQEYKVA